MGELEETFLQNVKQGNINGARTCLTQGVNIDTQDENGFTAVNVGSYCGYKDIVDMLIAHGADINKTTTLGFSPLAYAAQEGHKDIIESLLNASADVNIKNQYGCTPLYLSAQYGHTDIVYLLIKYKADIDEPDNVGYTPLSIAARFGHDSVVDILLRNKADINKKMIDGLNGADLAKHYGHDSIVAMFENLKLGDLLSSHTDVTNVSKPTKIQAKSEGRVKKRFPFDVFISYCHKDRENVMRVCDRLKSDVDKIWIDENEIRGNLLTDMANGIANSSVVVLFMSENYFNSKSCMKEAIAADEEDKAIVPVRIQAKYKATSWLKMVTAGKTYYDLSGEDKLNDNYGKFLEAIRYQMR